MNRTRYIADIGGNTYKVVVHAKKEITQSQKDGSKNAFDNTNKKTRDHLIDYVDRNWQSGFINVYYLHKIFDLKMDDVIHITYHHYVREKKLSVLFYKDYKITNSRIENGGFMTSVGVIKPYIRGDFLYDSTMKLIESREEIDEILDKGAGRLRL